MKKFLAIMLAALMVLAMVACSSSETPAAAPASSSESSSAKTDTAAKEDEAPAAEAAKSYQLVGVYEEEGGNASMLNAAFLLNLNEDGTAVADRYQFAQFNASPAAENPTFQASYLSGTWKEVEKDGIPCLQIKLAYVDETGAESNASTNYAYEVAGEYSFDLSFPVVPGMSYSRVAPMAGGETKQYADADAFIQAYKKDFVAPEHVAEFTAEGATAYLTAEGKVLFYLGVDKNAEGTWTNDGALAITINDAAQDVKVDGNKASFTYSVDRGDGNLIDFELVCEDISVLGAPEAAEVAADAPYAGGQIDLGGNPYDATLALNEDGTATLTVAMSMTVNCEKVGKAVVLTENPDAPLEGYGASIFASVPHVWLLNDEAKTMTALKGAYMIAGKVALYLVDDASLTAEYVDASFAKEGFGYTLSEDGTQLTVTAPEDLGAFAQVWDAMGGVNFTLEGTTATVVAE